MFIKSNCDKNLINQVILVYEKRMVVWLIIICVAAVIAIAILVRHQHRLKERAWLIREALHNHDFSFRLPTRGLPSGERAMQQLLNDMGQEIRALMAKNEVESWQRLTRVLTHEIMNATAPISSITQSFLDRPDVKGTPLEDGIRAIRDTSSGLTSFVESYRKFMLLQKAEPTDIQLREVAESVQSLYPSLNWNVAIDSEQMVHADANLLRQVLTNLVKNAQEAGATLMDIRWREDYSVLTVSNDGAPIPAEIRKEIFVPFFTTKRRGSGIGLALSRQMMVMQGGDLTLCDAHVGGCNVTFQIVLLSSR